MTNEFRKALPETADAAEAIRDERTWKAPKGSEWLDEPMQRTLSGTTNANYLELLPEQRDFIRNSWSTLGGAYSYVLGLAADIQARIASRTLWGLLIVLGALLASGVIAPLFYLSSRGGSSRDGLLWAFVAFSLIFLLFLGNEVKRLKGALDLEKLSW